MHATVPLLHIDDSASDRLLIKEAIALTKTPFLLFQADGLDSAVEYLQTQKTSQTDLCPRPALVLLDYDLGGGDTGCTFLNWFRLVKKNNITPVVMLSSSTGKGNVEECYAAGANHFLVKPHTMERFKAIVRTLFISVSQPGVISLLAEYIADPKHRSAAASHR